MEKLPAQIQALLFAEGGSRTYKSLAKLLAVDEATLSAALEQLAVHLEGSGLALVRSDTEAILSIAHDAREVVLNVANEEYSRDIGDAALEVLAVLLYEGPSTRASIDYIRGVNSSSSIRTLLMRGLIERSGNPLDGREYVYRATTDLLAHLGVTEREKMPEYDTIAPELAAFKASNVDHGTDSTNITRDGSTDSSPR